MQKYNVNTASGTFDGLTATTVGGNAVFLGSTYKKVADLSALVVVDVETDTMTMYGKWQVCNTAAGTYLDILHAPQNPAAVLFATGTGGADASVTKVFPAPAGIYGWKFARFALTNAVAAGGVADTYTIGYCYHQLSGAEGAV